MRFVVVACAVFCCLWVATDASMIDDFFTGVRDLWPKGNDVSTEKKTKKLPGVQFELPIENEEFLKEGLALINSPREALDLCTHRVVQTLKKNCNQLTLEEVGKLAVMMLNCQLEIEGREMFPCKPEMTLQQCTMGMDADKYKIYNYMTHRAIGICSALKQDQFRALAEMTVNRLMTAAQSQITAMHESLKNQRRLNEMGIENLREFQDNDGKIKDSQIVTLEQLKRTGNLIDENLAVLHQELELRQKSEVNLKSTMELSEKLAQHTIELHEEHDKLLNDVEKISESMQHNNEQLLQQYSQALEFLQQFQSILKIFSSIANNIKSYINHILETLGECGLEFTEEFIAACCLNVAYFTCGMIFIIFVEAKVICKKLLIGLFTFNTFVSYSKADIPLFSVNIFVWIGFFALKFLASLKQFVIDMWRNAIVFIEKRKIGNYFKLGGKKNIVNESESESEDDYRQRSVTPAPRQTNKVPASPRNSLNVLKKKVSNDVTDYDSEMSEIFANNTPSIREPSPIPLQRPLTPAMRRVMTQSLIEPSGRSATPFQSNMKGRVQCQALTNKGQQCKNAAVPGMTKCRIHNF